MGGWGGQGELVSLRHPSPLPVWLWGGWSILSQGRGGWGPSVNARTPKVVPSDGHLWMFGTAVTRRG